MDLRQIKYFLAVAETFNFTRAAEQCFVSQPALTQAIKKLEDELGGPLIHRDGRNTRLTELGRSLRAHFEKIQHTRDAITNIANEISRGERIELNIGLMCTIGPQCLSPLFDAFQANNRQISRVLHDVVYDAIPNLILSGALDGAFVARHEVRHDRLEYHRLYGEEMVVAFPKNHHFESMTAVPLEEVAKERYIDRLHCEFRDEFFDFSKGKDLNPQVAFCSEREDWIQHMIATEMGVSVLPRYSLVNENISFRPVTSPPMAREVELCVAASDVHSQALQNLVTFSREFASDLNT
ncbi:MAG: LysR family transcriptional regulator [Pseudomonadota bacterium]